MQRQFRRNTYNEKPAVTLSPYRRGRTPGSAHEGAVPGRPMLMGSTCSQALLYLSSIPWIDLQYEFVH